MRPREKGVAAFDRLQALVAEDLEAVNQIIRNRMVSEAAPLIKALAEHLISAGGKRLRPILTLAAAQMCGYGGEHHRRLAATVEFIHTATLLHDDVVDGSVRRRGKDAANIVWGNKPSILVGDFLFSRAFQLMVETGSLRVLEILSTASAVIAEGEVLQLSTVSDLTEDDGKYMQVVTAKTAALFEAATEVGGVIAGAPEPQIDALRTYGGGLGVAFQLVDDVLDYGGVDADAALGKAVGDDFRESKATLPVLLAYGQGDADERSFWERCIRNRDQEPADLERAIEILRRRGALAQTLERARGIVDDASAALLAMPAGAHRDALEDVAEYVVERAR
ncbi:MAG: polyprenyl synthetase family protein [Pseudomonadota bacterium]